MHNIMCTFNKYCSSCLCKYLKRGLEYQARYKYCQSSAKGLELKWLPWNRRNQQHARGQLGVWDNKEDDKASSPSTGGSHNSATQNEPGTGDAFATLCWVPGRAWPGLGHVDLPPITCPPFSCCPPLPGCWGSGSHFQDVLPSQARNDQRRGIA